MLIGLNVVSGSCISKLIGGKFSSFLILCCHFFSMPLFLLQLKTCCFLPGLYVRWSAQQHSLMKILLLRKREVLQQLKKITRATVLASIHSTGVTVVGSVNVTEFWQRGTQSPSLYYCSVTNWILQLQSDLSFVLAAKWFYYHYCFCDSYFCACFLHWCAVFHRNSLKQNRLFHDCSNKK